MSMPSDMTSDVSEAMESEPRFPGERLLGQFTREQRGWVAAAVITFVGVVYLGPALTRVNLKQRKLRDDAAKRAAEIRRRAREAGSQARKRVRRLGGGMIRR